MNIQVNFSDLKGLVAAENELLDALECVRLAISHIQAKRLAIEPKRIIAEVATEFRVKQRELLRSRKQEICDARFLCYVLLFEVLRSLSQVGRLLRLDHGTISYGLKAAQDLVDTKPAYRLKLQQLRRRLGMTEPKLLEASLED